MSIDPDDTVHFSTIASFDEAFFASGASGLPISFGAETHIGLVRERNEDQFAVLEYSRKLRTLACSIPKDELESPRSQSHVLVVADGIGGSHSGDHASRLAIQTMVHLAGDATSWVMKLNDLDAQQIHPRVDAYVKRIHATLQETAAQSDELAGMGTTWTSAHIFGNRCITVQIGDSRAYLFRHGQLKQITHDQTVAQALIDCGVEPERVSMFQHVLTNCLGGDLRRVTAAVQPVELEAGDWLLLCTDGLTGMVSDEEITEELLCHQSPEVACRALIERALAAGGKDNVTVVVAAFGGELV